MPDCTNSSIEDILVAFADAGQPLKVSRVMRQCEVLSKSSLRSIPSYAPPLPKPLHARPQFRLDVEGGTRMSTSSLEKEHRGNAKSKIVKDERGSAVRRNGAELCLIWQWQTTPNTTYTVGHTIFSTLFSVCKLDE
jgi:hypothetical protein